MKTQLFGTVTGGRLNLRAAASSSAAALIQIPNDTLLAVTEYDSAWYQTTYGQFSGYVMRQFITPQDFSQAAELSGTVTGGALNLRRTPSTSADRLIQIPNGTTVAVLDVNPDGDWYCTAYAGYVGFVMKQYIAITPPFLPDGWSYGQVTASTVNVRRQPSTSADRWNNVWPKDRIVLIRPSVDGWYESLYRGEPAYVAAEFIRVLDIPVPDNIVERMLYMAVPELARDDSVYFNGYSGEWCHRFADWLAMNAGMPAGLIPNTSNCGLGIVWFVNNENSVGFHFKNAEHKARFISNYGAVSHLSPELTQDEEAYIPAPGDYIYFRWSNADADVNVSHVGIVAAVSGNSLTTWEGNSGDKVVSRIFALDDVQIVGYGKPAYSALEA